MYKVELTDRAKRQLRKLPKEVQDRITGALARSRIRPHSFFEKLVGDWLYRLRVGKYRVLATIDNGRLIILVIKMGHRKNVYRRKR